jgi:hypothetical protein
MAETEEEACESEDLMALLWEDILAVEEPDGDVEIPAAEESGEHTETSAAEEPGADAEISAAEEPDGDESVSAAEGSEAKEENLAAEEPEEEEETDAETVATEEPGDDEEQGDRLEEESDVGTTSMGEGEIDESLNKGWRDRPVSRVQRPVSRRRPRESQCEDGATVEEFRRLKKSFMRWLADGNDSDDAELVSDDQSRAESLANDPG